jgi:hypothetical protein
VLLSQIDQVAGNAQLDWRLGRYFLRVERQENFLHRGEDTAFAFRAFLIAGQVINSEHDVL